MTDETAYNYVDNRGRWESACQHFEIQRREVRRSVYRRTFVAAFGALLLIWLFGCETVAQIVTAPLFIAEGFKESYDRKQTEKQEGHPYGRTDQSYRE